MRAPLLALLALMAGLPSYAQEAPPEEGAPAKEETPEADAPEAEPAAEDAEEPAADEAPAADDTAPEGDDSAESSDEAAAEDAPVPKIIPSEPVREAPPGAEQMAELAARIAELEATLDQQREELTKTKLSLVKPDEMTFELEGYYRTRGYVFNHLMQAQSEYNADGEETEYKGDARYMAHRLKLRPVFNYKDLAKFQMEIDMFGDPQFGQADVVWGDNQSRMPTALFAQDPSQTNAEGLLSQGPRLTRAWLEFGVPVGLIRVGRQPSNWGMGLLANDGNSFDDPFGENKFGSTFDRAIFATKPISVIQALTGKEGKEVPLIMAVGVDRLVEDPLFEYYGYQCDRDDDSDNVENGGPCQPSEDHSWQDEERVGQDRRPDWFADQGDDVMQMVYVIIYKGEDVKYLGAKGDLTAGSYIVNRKQKETGSNIVIADAYLKAKNRGFLVEFEGLTIQGKSSALALAGAFDPFGELEDPLYKDISIWGYSGRVGYERPSWKAVIEHGYASGDQNIADQDFTIRAIHPDHNVGLLLYDEVLARVTQNGWGDTRALWSNGGVYNSRYVFPWADFELIDNWNVIVGGVMAFPDKPDGAFIQCRDDEGCVVANADAKMIGWELDAALKISWHEHLRFSMETAYAHATDRLPLNNAGLNPKGNFYTFQTRMAYEF